MGHVQIVLLPSDIRFHDVPIVLFCFSLTTHLKLYCLILLPARPVDSVVETIRATDADSNSNLEYSIVSIQAFDPDGRSLSVLSQFDYRVSSHGVGRGGGGGGRAVMMIMGSSNGSSVMILHLWWLIG